MRFVLTALLWLVTTIALAAAVPAVWAQRHIVDVDGYATLARSAAGDPALQDAMASELTTQVLAITRNRGDAISDGLVRGIANTYTASPLFPGQFAQANRMAHQWLFTNSARRNGNAWVVDLAPMLADTSFQQVLNSLDIQLPSQVTVPVTVTGNVRPGQLHPLATWGPWASIGCAALTAILALLTLASARWRGKAIAGLGVSALLVGGGGWAALEVGRGRINDGLNHTSGNVRRIAEAMVAQAENSMHQWLNLTLAAGGVLVVFGIIVTMIGGLRRNG
ncbi:MAG: hypothetical protein JOZ49_24125 [Mycolicibacterium sp.]|nr:hypothetical protein [Mycolicibacterium sp.]